MTMSVASVVTRRSSSSFSPLGQVPVSCRSSSKSGSGVRFRSTQCCGTSAGN